MRAYGLIYQDFTSILFEIIPKYHFHHPSNHIIWLEGQLLIFSTFSQAIISKLHTSLKKELLNVIQVPDNISSLLMPVTWNIPLGVKTDMCKPQPQLPLLPCYPPNPQHPSTSSSPPVFPLKPHLSWSERKAFIICQDWDVNPCARDPSL